MSFQYLLAAAAMVVAPIPNAFPAAEPEWYRVSRAADATWYVDLASITTDGQWTSASEVSIYTKVSAKTGVKTVNLLTDYDCKARKMRYRRMTAFDADGGVKLDQEWPAGQKAFDLTPGTVISGVADYICGVNRGRGVPVEDPLTDLP